MVIAVDPYLLLYRPAKPMRECPLLRSQSRYPSPVESTPQLATTTQTTAAASQRISLCEAAVPVVPHSNMGHCLSKNHTFHQPFQLVASVKAASCPQHGCPCQPSPPLGLLTQAQRRVRAVARRFPIKWPGCAASIPCSPSCAPRGCAWIMVGLRTYVSADR